MWEVCGGASRLLEGASTLGCLGCLDRLGYLMVLTTTETTRDIHIVTRILSNPDNEVDVLELKKLETVVRERLAVEDHLHRVRRSM